MKIIYNLVGTSGIFASAPPTILSQNESISVLFCGAPTKTTAILKTNGASTYIDIVEGAITIPRDYVDKVIGGGLIKIHISVLQTEKPLKKWLCESIGLYNVGGKVFVFPYFEETREKLSELAEGYRVLIEKVDRIEKKMNTVDKKVSEFVGGDITE